MRILVTGGAGFIGSNLVKKWIQDDRISFIRVIDDFSNGYQENIKDFLDNDKFELVEGDISDYQTCLKAMDGIDVVSHQAALGSVPRSIANPMRSTEVNILGTVNIMHAAVKNNCNRVILAFSSSTYGDSNSLPKIEDNIGKALSPYAVTKSAIEDFARVFAKIYGIDYIGLRYFNVFGPNQSSENAYAAVIPKFCKAFITNQNPQIFGDGLTSRDFTFIDNVVEANTLSLFTSNEKAINQVYNVACGQQITLNEIIQGLQLISGKSIQAKYSEERVGDVKHSLADISKINQLLGYNVKVNFMEGLRLVYDHYTKTIL